MATHPITVITFHSTPEMSEVIRKHYLWTVNFLTIHPKAAVAVQSGPKRWMDWLALPSLKPSFKVGTVRRTWWGRDRLHGYILRNKLTLHAGLQWSISHINHMPIHHPHLSFGCVLLMSLLFPHWRWALALDASRKLQNRPSECCSLRGGL